MTVTISKAEKRVLQSLHLTGTMGKCGSLNAAKRKELLEGLISKKLLNKNCNLTKLGVNISLPSSPLTFEYDIC